MLRTDPSEEEVGYRAALQKQLMNFHFIPATEIEAALKAGEAARYGQVSQNVVLVIIRNKCSEVRCVIYYRMTSYPRGNISEREEKR